MSAIPELKPTDAVFSRRPDGALALKLAGGACHDPVRVRQMFPVTRPRQWLSIAGADGREVGVIRDLEAFPEEQQELLLAEAEHQYFVPRIREIQELHEESGFFLWEVVTDRGPRSFFVKGRTENIHHQGDGRLIIADVEECKYEIPDWQALDKASRRRLAGLV